MVRLVLRKHIQPVFQMGLSFLRLRLLRDCHLENWDLADLGGLDSLLVQMPLLGHFRIRSSQISPGPVMQVVLASIR